MNEFIAEQKMIGITPKEEEITIIVRIGKPYLVPGQEDIDEWACPISLEPLHKNLSDIHGMGSFQALTLAMRHIANSLNLFIERGGRLTYDGKTDIPLESYGFNQTNHT